MALFTKSALKSKKESQSPSPGKRLTVSFEDQKVTTPSTEVTLRFLNKSAEWLMPSNREVSWAQSPSSVSSNSSLSIQELTCDDTDDILPKTDYTYARTASYSKKYLRRKRYRSPNMSRKRLLGLEPSFLSDDDEDSLEEVDDDEDILEHRDNFLRRQQLTSDNQEDAIVSPINAHHNSESSQRFRMRRSTTTSTPATPHGSYHISAHDHYYDGMLLRSGSHVHGAMQKQMGLSKRSSMETDTLVPTYRSDADVLSNRRRGRSVTSVTTTITTTTSEEDEESKKRMAISDDEEEDYEAKQRLDESQTEKTLKANHYMLPHLYGLDSEDEISNEDDAFARLHVSTQAEDKKVNVKHKTAWYSFITTIVTTIITTITTAVAGQKDARLQRSTSSMSNSFYSHQQRSWWSVFTKMVTTIFTTLTSAAATTAHGMANVAVILCKPVTVPAGWMFHFLGSVCSFLVRSSASLLLWEMEAKHRKRRGCCLCLLPLLLLLPFGLLAVHYGSEMGQAIGNSVSSSRESFLSYWSSLRQSSLHLNIPVAPQPQQDQAVTPAVDMRELNEIIQRTVLQMVIEHRDNRPVGLTQEEVEAIARAILMKDISLVKNEFNSQMVAAAGVWSKDISSLKSKLGELDVELKKQDEQSQMAAVKTDETKASLESLSLEQKSEWMSVSNNLEAKLSYLKEEVEALTNKNTALAALLTSCCKNNSIIAETVQTQILAILSQIGKGDDDPAFAGLKSWIHGNYVDKAEFDERLSAVAVEVTEKLNFVLAHIKEEKAKTGDIEIQSTVVGGIDETTVKSIIEDALIQFSADRVGRPDFALESAGGSVLGVRCSETYYRKTALVSVFGIPLWYTSNSPRTVIQPSVHPGECWAFKGCSGFLVIQLSQPIQPTGFTLEHIPRSLAPNGVIDSAPKDFAVFGLSSEKDTSGTNLGNFTYLDNGKPIQFFPLQNGKPGNYQLVELRVLSNHGNPEYTCVYRFRVHGLP